jgi:hypothetical protein
VGCGYRWIIIPMSFKHAILPGFLVEIANSVISQEISELFD